MKKTVPLTVAASLHFPIGHFAIHPNDGFDLGMMTLSHTVQWCTKLSLNEFVQGSSGETNTIILDLLNECPKENFQLNFQQWKKIGSPAKVVIIYDDSRLFIQPLQSSEQTY